MESIWEILRLKETKDRAAIKRAYAALAKEYNPEEHPKEFLRIRDAYQKALRLAGQNAAGRRTAEEAAGAEAAGEEAADAEAVDVEAAGAESASTEGTEAPVLEEKSAFHWDFTEENPFRGGPAISSFRELFCGKRCRDRNAWADYFTSNDFLKGYREKDFAELLLETVKESCVQQPVNKEFLTELSIAYGLSSVSGQGALQIQMENNAAFYGIESIAEILRMGRGSIRFKGTDSAMIAGFRDYRELLSLAANDVWDDERMLRFGKLIDRYRLYNLSDRPIPNAAQYELTWRHPKSIRLLTYFLDNYALPDQCYRMLWSHLYLENAVQGKEALLYGKLREIVLSHMPQLADKPKISYKQLITDFSALTANLKQEPARAGELVELFWQREDMQAALMDEAFVERRILPFWVTRSSSAYVVAKLKEFYSEHGEAPYADRMLETIRAWEEWNRVNTELAQDEQAEILPGRFVLQERPYMRYFLHAAFPYTWGIRNHVLLSEYLQQVLPYSESWSRRFLHVEGDRLHPMESLKLQFGENILEVIFHLRYLEYQWNGSPLYGAAFAWEQVAGIEDDTVFWLLLPHTGAPFEEHPAVYQELVRRLSGLPVAESDIPVAADCITGGICQFTGDGGQPVCTLYRETLQKLYGCDVYRDGMLLLYEQTPRGKIQLPKGQRNAGQVEAGIQMGRRLLDELINPCSVAAEPAELPDSILIRDKWNRSNVLDAEQVTSEKLKEQLELYFAEKSNRLELTWKTRALIFLNNRGQYACFYFDHAASIWYALVGMPEVYAAVDSRDVVYVPFGLGKLPDYLIHQDLNYMKSRLQDIFSQVGSAKGKPKAMMWAPQVHRFETKVRYALDRRLYGGYRAEQVPNQITSPFYIPCLPCVVEYRDPEGRLPEQKTVVNGKAASGDKMMVQDKLVQYMQGRLLNLTLIWQYEEERDPNKLLQKRRIVLIQDQGSHQLVYEDEVKGSREYLVSDVREYMNAEGKKYKKAVFAGKTVPAYLVHQDMRRIRDCLDLLIPMIREPDGILNQFGEFAYLK